MERQGHDHRKQFLIASVVASFGMSIGGLTLWKLLSNQMKPIIISQENPEPKGLVAGVAIENDNNYPSQIHLLSPTPIITRTAIIPTQPQSAATSPPTIPTTSPSFLPSPSPTPLIGFQNGDFSDDLRYWQTRGEVGVLKLPFSEQIEPLNSIQNFVRLSSDSNLDWLGAHSLEQTFVMPANHVALEFWYRIHTQETEPGFDSPCLVVLINQQAVAWFSATDASETWQRFSVPLPNTGQSITLSFRAGQTGDQQKPTWIDITNVYTLDQLFNLSVIKPLSADSRLRLSFSTDATIGVSFVSEETETASPQFTQKLNSELLLPELALQQTLHNLPWQPDGAGFQPAITSPDFYGLNSGFYAAHSENPWNLPEQLNQLKARYQNVPIKLWMVVKTALGEALQLLPVDY
jgi:hypothetical protein